MSDSYNSVRHICGSDILKILLSVIAVIIVIVIAFVTIVVANEGEDKAVEEYLAAQQTPSPSASPSLSPAEEPSPNIDLSRPIWARQSADRTSCGRRNLL